MATAGHAIRATSRSSRRATSSSRSRYSGVFAAGLKALHNAIMAERRPAGAGADDLRRRPALVPGA
jgi:hypothetical protein